MPNTYSLDLESGSSQYAARADTASLSITGDLSLEAWIKMESLGGTIASKYNEQGNQRSYLFDAGGELSFKYSSNGEGNPGTYSISSSNASLSTGVWYHVAMTIDVSAKTVIFYKNGVALTNGSATDNSAGTSIFNSTADFAIGKYQVNGPTNTNFFDGLVDEVRVWNDIRTAQEIADNYNIELVGNEAGLAGYWKLNNDYLDETSNNNDLTASGSPVFSTDVPFGLSSGALFFAQY